MQPGARWAVILAGDSGIDVSSGELWPGTRDFYGWLRHMADGGATAQAAVEIVADTSRFRDDLKRKLREAGTAAGENFGDAFADQAGDAGSEVGERLRKESSRSGEWAGISWGTRSVTRSRCGCRSPRSPRFSPRCGV